MPHVRQNEETCRICLESSPISTTSFSKISDSFFLEEDRLISPCACSGTQAFVHFKCLRRWQRSVMASRRPGSGLGPALVCSVCTQKFSLAPPRPALSCQLWKAFTGYSCEVTGLLIILCACYIALAGHSLQSLLDELEGGLALAREVLPCSLRFNSMDDDCSSGICSSLLGRKTWGSLGNSHRLHPGTILIATPSMSSPSFFGTVILLYEHQRCSGSRGLVLNKEAGEEVIHEWEKNVFLGTHSRAALKRIEHGSGGPVTQDQWSVLHRCTECAKCDTAEGSKRQMLSRDWGQELLPGYYLGQGFGPMLHHLDACKQRSKIQSSGDCTHDVESDVGRDSHDDDRAGENGGLGRGELNDSYEVVTSEGEFDDLDIKHYVLHGHAEWFVGQLGSEIRRGMWIVEENCSDVLHSTPLQDLWHALISAA